MIPVFASSRLNIFSSASLDFSGSLYAEYTFAGPGAEKSPEPIDFGPIETWDNKIVLL